MFYELKNEILTVKISDMGAELHSVRRGECEYMWQRDPEYWKDSAPILFPICGRLFEGKYTYEGKTYEMNLHGFARHTVYEAEEISDTEIVFRLHEDETSLSQYPFRFALEIRYTLDGEELKTAITVKNTDEKVLPYAVGAHPGFNVPLDGNGQFSDYVLEFGEECSPDKIIFSETCFDTGMKKALPLKDGKIFPLYHSLFDHDGIFMANMARKVTLKSEKTDRFVTLKYPQMQYLGIWHKPKTEAPYVCIEPWCGLPSYDGIVDDFAEKSNMFRILPGRENTYAYSIIFG